MYRTTLSLFLLLFAFSCNEMSSETTSQTKEEIAPTDSKKVSLKYPEEKNFKTLRQLTNGGDNAEAYFNFGNDELVLQVTNKEWGLECDQIFHLPLDTPKGQKLKMLSTGKGRTTCSYFMPGDSTILYASTHKGGDGCLDAPRSVDGKYVWSIFDTYDIYEADLEGNIIRALTDGEGYDAEATVSPDGKKIVFTSTRSNDLELYTMDIDGSNVKQVTNELGYDGGAFFSPDSKQLVFRASRPTSEEDIKNYKHFFDQGLVQPTNMEIFVCDVDGQNMKQITNLGGANWAPFFHPSGEKIIFASNHHTDSRRVFNLFSTNLDGTELKQITFDNTFDSFPMFSFDGKYFVFSSNRNNGGGRDTNVFLAEWID